MAARVGRGTFCRFLAAHPRCSLLDHKVDLRALGRHLLLGAVDGARRGSWSSAVSPAALAWKVSTQTTPEPLTPAAPGGRAATMVMLPGPSSRWISATACPSRLSRVAGGHVDQRKFGRIVLNLHRHRSNIRGSAEHDRNLEGGSRGDRTRWRSERKGGCPARVPAADCERRLAAGLRGAGSGCFARLRSSGPSAAAPQPPRSGRGRCPRRDVLECGGANDGAGAPAERAAAVHRWAWRRSMCLAGAGVDGAQIHLVQLLRTNDVRHHQEDEFVVVDGVVLGAEEVLEDGNRTQPGNAGPALLAPGCSECRRGCWPRPRAGGSPGPRRAG